MGRGRTDSVKRGGAEAHHRHSLMGADPARPPMAQARAARTVLLRSCCLHVGFGGREHIRSEVVGFIVHGGGT